MNDPYLDNNNCIERLYQDYLKHKSLCVAVDFDSTIFPLHDKTTRFPAVIQLLKECNNLGFPLVIFSASPKERYGEIKEYCKEIGIKIEGINCDVVDWNPQRKILDYSQSKIFFNVLLDDRAGLPSAYTALREVVDRITYKYK